MRLIERGDCPMRHENGNCTAAGGFCTAVNDPICEALHNAFYCGEQSKIEWATMIVAEQTTKHAQKTLEVLQKIHEKVTAEAEPVKHGRWLYDSGSGEYFCSNCGEYALSFKKDTLCWDDDLAEDLYEACLTDYCPNCGAKMDLEE